MIDKVCAALISDCSSKNASNYLIQHATGSGKTLAMAALAHAISRLSDEHGKQFSLVIVISDRVILDEQLHDAVSGYFDHLGERDKVERIESCAHFRELLERRRGTCTSKQSGTRIVVSTFQKADSSRASAPEDSCTPFGETYGIDSGEDNSTSVCNDYDEAPSRCESTSRLCTRDHAGGARCDPRRRSASIARP